MLAHEEVAILIVLRQLIDDGRFQEAKDRLVFLGEADFSASGKIGFVQLLSLKGKIHFHLADFAEALAAASRGLALVRGTDDNSLIAELQSTIARSYTEIGRINEAEREYRDLISTYRRLDDTAGIIRCLNRLSRICFIRSQFGKAADYLLEASDYARGIEDQKWEAMIQGNLGTIFNLTGEFPKAIQFFERSIALNRSLANDLNLCRALLSLSYAQMHLKDFPAAEQSLAQAEAIVAISEFEAERQTLNQYRATMALLQGDLAKALELAQGVLNRACDQADQSATICQAGRIIAEAQLQLGNLHAARKIAQSALETARKIGQRVEIGVCQRVLAQILHHLGSIEASEECFADAVSELSETGARFELAMTCLIRSQLTADPGLKTGYRHEASRIFQALRIDHVYARKPRAKSAISAGDVPLVGESADFQAMVRQASICATSEIPVLLLGETGTGKDQFAKYIHAHSARSKGALIQVNCAAIPIELAESELFGYEKGAFTNASEQKVGLLEAADGGTLFLNEIGELPLRLQAKLLAALEEKKFFKLGGTTPRKVDFRLLAATNVDLSQAVREGKFRPDLYYRLAVMILQIPRLAARGSDAFQLLRHFLDLEQISLEDVDARLREELKAACRLYSWPGNIRELKNYVELFTLTEQRDPRSVCRKLLARLQSSSAVPTQRKEAVNLNQEIEEFERSRIDAALEGCGGIIRRAASYLGLPEATLRSKLKKYRISAA